MRALATGFPPGDALVAPGRQNPARQRRKTCKQMNNAMPQKHPLKYDVKQMEQEIVRCDGNLTAVAKGLGCQRLTIYDYIRRFPELGKAVDAAREKVGDEAVGQLHKLVREGHFPAIQFYLKTQHGRRGFTDRVELTGIDGEPISYRAVKQEARPSLEELKAALAPQTAQNRITEYTD